MLLLSEDLFLMFQCQSDGCDITHFCWSVVLNSTWIYEAGILSPFFAVRFEVLKRCTVQFNQSFSDNRFVFAMSSFDVHHLGDWHTTCNPFTCRCRQVRYFGKVSVVTILDQHKCIVSKGVAVVCIEVRWECTSSFVSKEMMKGTEFAIVCTSSSSCFQFIFYQSREQLFRFDQRYLYVSVWISFQE